MEPGPASPLATSDSTSSVAAELRRGLETLAQSSPNLEERIQAVAALKAIDEEAKRTDTAQAAARRYLAALIQPKASPDASTTKLQPPHPQSVAADNQQQLNSSTQPTPSQHSKIDELQAKLEAALATTADERKRAAEEAVEAAMNRDKRQPNFPKTCDDLPAPLRPQFTGRAEDFHSFNSRLLAYCEYFHIDEWLNREPQNRQERELAHHTMRILQEAVDVTQQFSRSVELAPLVQRQAVALLIEHSPTPAAAYHNLVQHFQYVATPPRRAHLRKLFDDNKQHERRILDWWDELNMQAAELNRLGCSIRADDVLVNAMANASPFWSDKIILARKLNGDNLHAIRADLQDIQDTRDSRGKDVARTPPQRRPDRAPARRTYVTGTEAPFIDDDLAILEEQAARDARRTYLAGAQDVPTRRRSLADSPMPPMDSQTAAYLLQAYRVDIRGRCRGCMEEGHRQFDVRDGKWVCPATQRLQADGKIPAPGPGDGEPSPRRPARTQDRRAFVTQADLHAALAAAVEETDTDNGRRTNNSGHMTDDGDLNTGTDHSPRRLHLSSMAQAYLTHNATTKHVSPTDWLWDTCSDAHLTGDRSLFLPGTLQPSPIRVSGATPHATAGTESGILQLRIRRRDGTLSPTLRMRGYYVQDLPVNILSKNAIKDEHGSAFADSKPDVRTERRLDLVHAESDVHTSSKTIAFEIQAIESYHVAALNAYFSRSFPRHGRPHAHAYPTRTDPPTAKELRHSPRSAIGLRVRNEFTDGTCANGTVVDYDATSKWWRIRYDDEYTDLDRMEEDSNAAETAHAIHMFLKYTEETRLPSDRGLQGIPGHEEYQLTETMWKLVEHWFGQHTHEACGRDDGANCRLTSHGSLSRPFESYQPGEEENIFLNPVFSRAQHFLDAAHAKHTANPTIAITAIVPAWDDLTLAGWTIAHTWPTGTEVFQHPNGDSAGPIHWPVHVLRLEAAHIDAVPEDHAAPSTDTEYGLDPRRASCRSTDAFSAKERRNLETHCMFGHKSEAVLAQMVKSGQLSPKLYDANAAMPFCDGCAKGLMRKRDNRIRLHHGVKPVPTPGEILIADYVPLTHAAIANITGILVVTDKCTRYSMALPLKGPGDMEHCFKQAIAFWTSQRRTVRIIKTDRGSNLLAKPLREWFADNKIAPQPTTADDHHQAGGVEKPIDLLKRMARAWMHSLNLGDEYIAHAIMHAAHIVNRTPMKSLDWRIPFTLATGNRPDLASLGIFGARCFSRTPAPERPGKFSERSQEGVYLGYDPDRHGASEPGHLIWRTRTKEIVSSRTVSFDHSALWERQPRTYTSSTMPEFGGTPLKDPPNRRAMLNGPHAAEFTRGETDELSALNELGCWSRRRRADLPPGAVVLPSTWAYRYKLDPITGDVLRYKARFCVRGDREREVHARFSAQVALISLRLLLALHGAGRLPCMSAFDVGNAYANTPQARPIFIEQPPGYHDDTDDVLELHRALYGQKDAGRQFWLHLESVLIAGGFTQSAADPCLFFRGSLADGNLCVVCTYVDDVCCVASRPVDVEEAYATVNSAFDKITREDNPSKLIGLQLDRAADGSLLVHQHAYAERLIATFSDWTTTWRTPAASEPPTTPAEPLSSDMTRTFRKLVGMLLYLAYWSRPDLAQAVRSAAQGMAAPTEHHLAAATRAFGYLRAHPHRPLVYGRTASPANVRVFVDADHAGSPDRKSISGMTMLLDGQGAFAWRSSKQHLVATSSTEAELIALADNCSTISVVRRVLGELGLLAAGPTTIMEDNISAITIIRDIVYNGRTKHIDVRLKNLRDHVKRKALELQHIDTKEQIADIFTKGLGREAFERLSERLMGESRSHSLRTVTREE